MKSIVLTFNTTQGIQEVVYNLAENPIAVRWCNKINLLNERNISVDPNFTGRSFGKPITYQDSKKSLDAIIDWVNANTDYVIDKKDHYNQDDLVSMHDTYIDIANDARYDSFNETYLLNTYIHECENTMHRSYTPVSFPIAWGTNDGVTMEAFEPSDYNYYVDRLEVGNLYLVWSEMGKKPSHYFRDKDPDDLATFSKTVKPHVSWSARCEIPLVDLAPMTFSKNFQDWFSKYKSVFLDQYNLNDWQSLHESGGVPLAQIKNRQDHLNLVNNFKSLISIRVSD